MDALLLPLLAAHLLSSLPRFSVLAQFNLVAVLNYLPLLFQEAVVVVLLLEDGLELALQVFLVGEQVFNHFDLLFDSLRHLLLELVLLLLSFRVQGRQVLLCDGLFLLTQLAHQVYGFGLLVALQFQLH